MLKSILQFLAGIGAAIIHFTKRAVFKEKQFDDSLKLRDKPTHDNKLRDEEQKIRDEIKKEVEGQK